MSCGDRQEPIFTDDPDRNLETLGEACAKTDWQIHSWCLMSNHFHLVVDTPRADLADDMEWFLVTCIPAGRKKFRHLFSGRYNDLLVEGSGDDYPSKPFATMCL